MAIGVWQILIIVYVLFLAVGPRRVVRWVQWSIDTNARLRGRPPPARKRWGLLRFLGLFEYSTPIGWACAAIGLGLAMSGYFYPEWRIPLTLLAMLFLFIAPWLI